MKQLIETSHYYGCESIETTGKIFLDEATPERVLDWLQSEVIENAKWLGLEEHQICVCEYDSDEERFFISGDGDFLCFYLEDCEVINL